MLCPEGTSVQSLDRLIRRGASDVLHKPLNRASLLHSIDTLFRTLVDEKKSELLRDKGNEYKSELMRERAAVKSRAASGAGSNNTLGLGGWSSARATMATLAGGSDHSLAPIRALLVDETCSVDAAGNIVLSQQAARIRDWIASVVLQLHVAHSCERAVAIMDELAADANVASAAAASAAAASSAAMPASSGHHSHLRVPGAVGGTIALALGLPHSNGGADDSSPSTTLSLSTGSMVPLAHTPPPHVMIQGVEMIILEYTLLETAAAAFGKRGSKGATNSTTDNGHSGSESDPHLNHLGLAPPSNSPSPSFSPQSASAIAARALIERIQRACSSDSSSLSAGSPVLASSAPSGSPNVVLLVEDTSEVRSSVLALLRRCASVSIVPLPLSADSLSKKVGIVVESILQQREKHRLAHRARMYRSMLAKIRDKKRGISGRVSHAHAGQLTPGTGLATPDGSSTYSSSSSASLPRPAPSALPAAASSFTLPDDEREQHGSIEIDPSVTLSFDFNATASQSNHTDAQRTRHTQQAR